ncbi:class I glutamine amidotransferase-like protein [Trichoderma pleuroticola]
MGSRPQAVPRVYTVAILECDTPIEPVVKQFGSYGDIFERFLRNGLAQYLKHTTSQHVDLQLIKSNMVDLGDLPAFDQVDCLLLTGSKHNSFEDDPWILRLVEHIRTAYQTTEIPIVGVCFGHQIIARALGGVIQRNPKGWEVSVDSINLTLKGRELFNCASLDLHQMHRDAVLQLPDGIDNLGTSSVCGIQGLYAPGRIFSLQAHPEFNGVIMSEILTLRRSQNVFDKEMSESAMSRADAHHDGAIVGEAVWKFLMEG